MKSSLSIEERFGKYYTKIKAKNFLSKQVSGEIKEEKKKIIQIIQSFEDHFSPDSVNLENLSFLSSIKSPDAKFTIKLKEESGNEDQTKTDFLNDINVIDFKDNYFIEPIITSNNNSEKNREKRKNDILEDVEEKVKQKNIIIKALIYFNKDNVENNIENFNKRIPDYYKSKSEEDIKFEKNVYIKIEDRIREYLNKYKSDKLSLLRDFENNYLVRILNFQKKSENYKFLGIKSIILGIINLVNDLIGKEYWKTLEDSQKDKDNKEELMIEIFKKYETMKKICILLEKDFGVFLENFKESNNNNKFELKLSDLFSDLFWDYVFRIKEINLNFTNYYNNDKITEKMYYIMGNIIQILFSIDLPYKKLAGEIFNITCIKQEKIYLMDYIIKYKNPLINNISIDKNNTEKNKLSNSSSFDKIIIINKITNIDDDERDNKTETKSNSKEDDCDNIIIDKEKLNSNLDSDVINKNKIMDNNDDLKLTKSLSAEPNNELGGGHKFSERNSLEEVYNYILYGESEKKKQKKRHKKRRKNKNNSLNEEINEEKNDEDQIDPIVEDYKNFINDINKDDNVYIKKIKPNINKEWIHFISTLD